MFLFCFVNLATKLTLSGTRMRKIISRVFFNNAVKPLDENFPFFLQVMTMIVVGIALVFCVIFQIGTKEPSSDLSLKRKLSTSFMVSLW